MSKAVNSKWKKIFPDTIGNQNRPATGVDDTQPFETGAFPQYIANDPVRYDLQNAAMSQLMSNDARLKEMVGARGKELDDHKVDPGAHKTGIAGNAATATKVVTTAATGASANIAEASMGGSDSARIRVSDAENAGELALETANDGDEAIVARQYTGVYTNAVRTAKILDESGNTSFPGTVVAPKFTGTLNGNAATATKLKTPRTLSLTGKASGSATFDGSSNAAINVKSVNADTASKLSTARKINITGNATGAANFDGSSDVSISVTVDESKHAAAADTATKVNATAPNGGTADLVFGTMAQNDYARVRVGGSNNNGWLEIATSGDGKEPIYVRQYGGAVWPNGSVVNEAALLDTSGNTKFPHDVTATNFKGHLAGNADTATTATKVDCGDPGSFIINKPGCNDYSPTVGGPYANVTIDSWFGVSFTSQCGGIVPKGKTAVGIDCRNGIVRANSFEGTLNGNASSATHASSADNATNADKVDGVHADSLFYNKGIWDANNWATIGAYQVNGNPPVSDAYGWGQVISSSTNDARFQLYASAQNNNGRLRYRTGWDNGKDHPWNTILDSENYNKYAPTKTGGGASGTWGINISGNAAGLSGDLVFPEIGNTNVSRKITWNSSTDGADIYYQTTERDQGNLVLNLRDDANCYLRIAANGAFKSYFSPDGVFHGNVDNADTVDGYHASDLLRTLGGNRTPVITDIFDRAGTIDMSTMSAADKANHKASINKTPNMVQNLWNDACGIYAYGGDTDMNGYNRGTLKLTQSYKNFDKILVVVTNDDANWVAYCMWDVWELAHAFANSYRFNLSTDEDIQWNVYGTAKHGTITNYAVSTDTIWNAQRQNAGIIAIYGIKF